MRTMLGTEVSKRILSYLPPSDLPQAGVVNRQFSQGLKEQIKVRLFDRIANKRSLYQSLVLQTPEMAMAYMDMIDLGLPMKPIKELHVPEYMKFQTQGGNSIFKPETEILSFYHYPIQVLVVPEVGKNYFHPTYTETIVPGSIPPTVKKIMNVRRPIVPGSIPFGATYIQFTSYREPEYPITADLFPRSLEKVVVLERWYYILRDVEEIADDPQMRAMFRFTEIPEWKDGNTWEEQEDKIQWEEEIGAVYDPE